MKFKRLSELDLEGLRVFIRSDLNVPMDDQGAISDDTRIRASVPAIAECLEKGAAVMVTSHLGRPKEGELKGILDFNTEPLVSIDFNHNAASSTYDATLTKVSGRLVKVSSWYDNEWGFSNRMLDTTVALVAAK